MRAQEGGRGRGREGGEDIIAEMIGEASRGSEVPLRSLWCIAKGARGRFWQSTKRRIRDRCMGVDISVYASTNGCSGAGTLVARGCSDSIAMLLASMVKLIRPVG